MTETIIVALIGVGATLLGMFGNSIIENGKAKSERHLYIAKVQFDQEFKIYQSLSEKHLTMVYDVGASVVIARSKSLPDGIQNYKDYTRIVAQHINDAEMDNKRNAPFISKPIYESYKELGKLAYEAISMFDLWSKFEEMSCNKIKYNEKEYTETEALKELEERQKKVSNLSDSILDEVRNYLNRKNDD